MKLIDITAPPAPREVPGIPEKERTGNAAFIASHLLPPQTSQSDFVGRADPLFPLVDGVLYDRVKIPPGPIQYVYFFTDVGASSGKTLAQSNVYLPQKLSAPEEFLVKQVQFVVHPSILDRDLAELQTKAGWQFCIRPAHLFARPTHAQWSGEISNRRYGAGRRHGVRFPTGRIYRKNSVCRCSGRSRHLPRSDLLGGRKRKWGRSGRRSGHAGGLAGNLSPRRLLNNLAGIGCKMVHRNIT